MSKTCTYYNMPSSPKDKVKALCKIIGINPKYFKNAQPEAALVFLVEVILYHRIKNRVRKRRIMERVHSMPGPLKQKLIGKITNGLVNKVWEPYSLTNQELDEYKNILDTFISVGGAIGFGGPSAKTTYDVVMKNRVKGLWMRAALLASYFLYFDSQASGRLSKEKTRRMYDPNNPSSSLCVRDY
jgi:hypothetical protein